MSYAGYSSVASGLSYAPAYTALSIISYARTDNYNLNSTLFTQQSTYNERQTTNYHPTAADDSHSSIIVTEYLSDDRPWTPIINTLGEVKDIIDQTFNAITGHDFPHESIRIVICNPTQFKSIYESTGGNFSPGIMGFSFNKFGKGASAIYVKEEHMDSLLLTIGHEIGHVLSPTLSTPQDEEAKAHAFSIAWMETIRDNDIAGLQPNISLNPAKNGVHDVGYDFVKYLMQTGSSALDVFKTLSTGLASILARMEV